MCDVMLQGADPGCGHVSAARVHAPSGVILAEHANTARALLWNSHLTL